LKSFHDVKSSDRHIHPTKKEINLVAQKSSGWKTCRHRKNYIAPLSQAPVIVIFGGGHERMDEVVTLIKDHPKTVTVIGNFSEKEGLKKLQALKKVDLVHIGGRYTEGQRMRMKKYLSEHFSKVPTTEPGFQYPYNNIEILKDIRLKLNLF
jgi:hypothetical protein